MAEVNMNNYTNTNNMANNPNLPRREEEDVKAKVIQGSAKKDKPKLGKRLAGFLASDKLDSIGNYLLYYIFGPSLKDLVWKMGNGALSMVLFGNGSVQAPPNGGNYIPGYGYQSARRDPYPYNMVGQPGYPGYGYANPQPAPMGYAAQRVTVNDISFDTKDDAWLVLDRMGKDLARYGKVKVADFYTYAGITGQESNWTLQGTGWTDLRTATPMMRTDGRWMINFPPVQTL